MSKSLLKQDEPSRIFREGMISISSCAFGMIVMAIIIWLYGTMPSIKIEVDEQNATITTSPGVRVQIYVPVESGWVGTTIERMDREDEVVTILTPPILIREVEVGAQEPITPPSEMPPGQG